MPIIASLNGSTIGGWIRYAGLIEQAGADALELNIYNVPIDPEVNSFHVEQGYVRIVRAIRQNIKIPIAVKCGPYFSSMSNVTRELAGVGANGLVLFNRYLAPDIDLDDMQFVPALTLSTPDELRVALRWIAILRDQTDISLVATGGVHSANDVVKAILVGANAVACTSVLLQEGVGKFNELVDGLADWMRKNHYDSCLQMRGTMSMQHCPNPEGLKRANYMRALTSYTPTESP
jgi:dihydroorotate dehydrogenase (fumarate)